MNRPVRAEQARPLAGIGLGLRIELASALFADEAPPVDFVEVHPENFVDRGGAHATMLERAASQFAIVTHGLTMGFGGVDAPSPERLRTLRAFLERVDSPLHSDHFCFAASGGRHPHELLPLPFDAAARDVAVERLARMRDATGRPIAVENVSYYVPRSRDPLDEIDVLAEVLDRADAKLLLDVNNVVVNAHNHGFDPRAWLARVPYSRVAQIHVAGHLIRPDGLRIDTHGARSDDECRELLAEVLARTGPVPVLLERDSEIPAYSALRDELRELRSLYDRAVARAPAVASGAARVHSVDRVDRVDRVLELRSLPSADAPAPRAGEPEDLATLEARIVSHVLDREEARLGEGLVASRWDLYRRMTRGRLDDLFHGAFPRTRTTLGAVVFDARVTEHLDRREPSSPIFWRMAEALGVFLASTSAPGSRAHDIVRLELAEWRVRHAPYPTKPRADPIRFDARPALNPAHERFEATHAVHELRHDGGAPREAPSTLVVFRRSDDGAATLSLNPIASAIFERFRCGDATIQEAVTDATRARGVRVDAAFLEALATTLAQWVELGLVLGVSPSERAPADLTDG